MQDSIASSLCVVVLKYVRRWKHDRNDGCKSAEHYIFRGARRAGTSLKTGWRLAQCRILQYGRLIVMNLHCFTNETMLSH